MKKMKVFFIAAALVLVTAGVFAGKSKFASISNVYGYNTTVGYLELLSGTITTVDLTTTGTTQATIHGATQTLALYYSPTSGTYDKLFASGF